jgi:L-threonylcarbamoyladenylate synthase
MGWGIGCDATVNSAVNRLFDLSTPSHQRDIICLVGNDAMLERHVAEVPEVAWDIIDLGTKPTSIIYDLPRELAEDLLHKIPSLPVQVVKDSFCRYLINRFKKPLVFTPAHLRTDPLPSQFGEIAAGVLKAVDYVVNLQRDQRKAVPSSLIALGNDGTVKVIRD